ncbi:hypothetical protein TWF718_007061 [Orbilia javanica]|uniref:Apple domain-containing protein n=1 Tax=Orbilia javanica TaxID=47235 RepID=A0AAN8RDK2_9PEZI
MRFFNVSSLLLPLLVLTFESTLIAGSAIDSRAAAPPKCDKKCAKSLIRRNVRSKSFCSSYLRAHGAPAHTVTVTTKASCVTVVRTIVTTELDIFSVASVSTTLPTITLTEYSSTVIIATGPTRVINRRAIEETKLAPRAASPPCTCRSLSSCSANVISVACLEISPPRTFTKTVTKPCTTTSTTSSTTLKFTEITSGTQTLYPPPATTTINEIHTTLVPEECSRELYSPPLDVGGAAVETLDYPYFAINYLECCMACFGRVGCAAAAYSQGSGLCSLLIVKERQAGGVSEACPLGRQDFSFIRDFDFGVNTLPGPCGF